MKAKLVPQLSGQFICDHDDQLLAKLIGTGTSSTIMTPTTTKVKINTSTSNSGAGATNATGTTKVTKIRRTRQSRNPQLSVARRNERERNRVKQVNNGFAKLREHLPIEYLQATSGDGNESSGAAGCDTPDTIPGSQTQLITNFGASRRGTKISVIKSKKFSKVETLRAAIQHIRMLEELIRTAEPDFESIQIMPSSAGDESNSLLGYDEIDDPLSIVEPLSCASSSSASTTKNHHQQQQQQFLSNQHFINQQQHQQPIEMMYQTSAQTSEQFVKLEPQIHNQQQIQPLRNQQANTIVANDDNDTTTTSSGQQQYQLTQVHLNQLLQQQQQMSPISGEPLSEHTNLWIQQHQGSFIEQQQQQQYQHHQQQQQQLQWYQQQMAFEQQQQQLSPVSTLDSPTGSTSTTATSLHHNQQQPLQQAASTIWYTVESSPSPLFMQNNQHQLQQVADQQHQLSHHFNQQALAANTVTNSFGSHQQHQISLFSQ